MNRDWSVKEAVDLFFTDGKKDGDLLSHEWISFALRIPSDFAKEQPFLLLERWSAFKDVLLKDHKIALQNVRGKGYLVVPPREQAEFAARTSSAQIQKALQVGSDLLEYTRTDELTTDEAKRHTDTAVRFAGLTGMIKRARRDVLEAFTPGKKMEQKLLSRG